MAAAPLAGLFFSFNPEINSQKDVFEKGLQLMEKSLNQIFIFEVFVFCLSVSDMQKIFCVY